MTDDKKPEGDATNKTAKATFDSICAENEVLKKDNTVKDALITNLTKQLQETTDILTAQAKAKIIKDILPRCKIPVTNLEKMSIDELNQAKMVVDAATPSSPGIHFDSISVERPKSPLADLYRKKQGEV